MKLLKTYVVLPVVTVAALLLSACAAPTVNYVDPNAVNNLTTNFTQNDLRSVAQSMSDELIQSGKINHCKYFTISSIANDTDQYVDTSVMSNAMADKLMNSSAVHSDYVVDAKGMKNQKAELNRQNDSGLYAKKTTAHKGHMIGAQCRIDGKLTSNTSISPDGKRTLKSYTFFVQLLNIKEGVALWRNSKNISKVQVD